jgi:CBS domain containing-hemolysin-like protein
MNAPPSILAASRGRRSGVMLLLALLSTTLLPQSAHASLFKGEALDTVANIMSWVVLCVVPIVLISVFWLVHILPEKIAEKRKHPQAKAIQCLCLLSLFFGGLFWPLAWLWAYSKPVLHKLAYGTDVDESHGHEAEPNNETEQLRARVAELESQLSRKGAV